MQSFGQKAVVRHLLGAISTAIQRLQLLHHHRTARKLQRALEETRFGQCAEFLTNSPTPKSLYPGSTVQLFRAVFTSSSGRQRSAAHNLNINFHPFSLSSSFSSNFPLKPPSFLFRAHTYRQPLHRARHLNFDLSRMPKLLIVLIFHLKVARFIPPKVANCRFLLVY